MPPRPAVKVMWNQERPSSVCETSILSSASISTAGAGKATVGPIMSVKRSCAAMFARPSSDLWNRYAQALAVFGDEIRRIHCVVRVAHAPVLLRIAQGARREHVQSFALT